MKTFKLFVSVLLAVTVTGCSLWAKDSQSSPVAEKSGSLLHIWVAGENRSIEAFSDFTAATGINVQAEFATQEEWCEQVLANKKKGGPPAADLFWSDNAIDLAVLAGLGAFEPHVSPFTASLPDYARDSDGLWYGLTERQLALVYHPSSFSGDLPATVEQLSDPKWQGRIAVPSGSSKLWYRILADVVAFEGETELQQLLERLSALGSPVSESPSKDVRRVADGEIPALLTTAESALTYMAEEGAGDNDIRIQPLGSKHAEQIDIVTGIAILRGTEQKEAAGKLIDYLLKEETRRGLAMQRAHDALLTGEESRTNGSMRLHPYEIARLVPLIERYWQMIFPETS